MGNFVGTVLTRSVMQTRLLSLVHGTQVLDSQAVRITSQSVTLPLNCQPMLPLASPPSNGCGNLHKSFCAPAVQAAGMLALLRERCGEELPAYLSAPQGPASAVASLPAFAADLAARLAPDRPDAKPLKALLQQAVKEARQQVWFIGHPREGKPRGISCPELVSCKQVMRCQRS